MLDTNVVAALLRSEQPAAKRLLALEPADVLVPQPVVAEVEYGVQRLPASKRRALLEHRARALFAALRRAEWTDGVSRHFGSIKADLERRGQRLEDFDVAVAAHALAFDAVLVTRNTKHLGRVSGLRLEDWATPG